jgi:tetraacyldisaccharide 4'-kinase
MNLLKIFLLPIAWVYGWGVRLRHWMFKVGILNSTSFNFPLIGVGNLSMGGTGKTPVIEYLIRLTSKKYNLATLSRGYGRKTTGFLKANQFSSYQEIGDEPLQYFKKFGKEIIVTVDEKRQRGIQNLISEEQTLDLILMDDSFQHKYVIPGLSILLTDFHNLYMNDYLFPAGSLRDTVSQAKYADIVIVTKGPKVLSPIERERITELLEIKEPQKLYFSYLLYSNYELVPGTKEKEVPEEITKIVLFTGIANSYPLQDHLRSKCKELTVIDYPDHHSFRRKDLQYIRKVFDEIISPKKILVTTEKDAMRLINSPYLSELLDLPVYYLPVRVEFHDPDKGEFNDQILSYVEKNKRNR